MNDQAVQPQETPENRNLYFNGFSVSISSHDIIFHLLRNNKTILILNTSHSIGKTLAEKLNGLIEDFELNTGVQILTLDEINKKADEHAKNNRN